MSLGTGIGLTSGMVPASAGPVLPDPVDGVYDSSSGIPGIASFYWNPAANAIGYFVSDDFGLGVDVGNTFAYQESIAPGTCKTYYVTSIGEGGYTSTPVSGFICAASLTTLPDINSVSLLKASENVIEVDFDASGVDVPNYLQITLYNAATNSEISYQTAMPWDFSVLFGGLTTGDSYYAIVKNMGDNTSNSDSFGLRSDNFLLE